MKYVPCEFSRDELFSVVLINDSDLANDLKQRNKVGNLTVTEMTEIKQADYDKVYSWYYYTNQAPILAFVNNEWRDEHDIKENLVILSTSDLDPHPYFLRGFLGYELDRDYIMVNQFMFTFRRETGYLHNNSTNDQWIWRDHYFSSTLQHPTYDYKDDYFAWFVMTLVYKLMRLWSAFIGFMCLSFVNGLVVKRNLDRSLESL